MDDILFFGITVAEFTEYSLKICFAGLILYMVFIIINLAKEAKADRYATIWMFIALGLGFIGFIAKALLQYFMSSE
ncbi:hypothetical protein FACS1894154_07990 [Betaproteobacteria bacterium]|nr:hypothetical protein FACS1894154_07990 [Betaproteobacteria bacterium]GHU06385.1 hypothetical protein AGMMS50225_01090 [Betaproteobacteria bacterium]GHU24544.1 hypothetical protein FACS189488_09420 [Betaproteobacteria bacterium]